MQYILFLLRRAAHSILVLLGLSIIIFIISRVMPGDPARMALGPYATQEQVAALRQEMGLDLPLWTQYVRYMSNLIQGQFGKSLISERDVRLDLAHHLPATLELIMMTMFWVVVIGIPLGALSAVKKDTAFDNLTRGFSFTAVVIPGFLVGIGFQLLFGYWLDWFPITGRLSPGTVVTQKITGLYLIDALILRDWHLFFDALKHILLPSLALSMAGIGQVIRITRSSMLEIETQDHVQVVRSYGVPNLLVTFKYILKPAFIPTLNILGLLSASLLGNAFLVESVFSWPGVAKYGVNAMLQKDINGLVGVVLLIGLGFLLANLIVDMIIGLLDPRIRLKGEAE